MLAVLVVGGCADSCNGDVAAVYVVPGDISVRRGETFALRARVIDKGGEIVPDGAAPQLKWTHGSQLSCDVCSGPVAQLRSPHAGTSYVEVAAGRWPSKRTNRITVRVVQSPSTPPSDWLLTPHSGSALPVAVLASGIVNTQPVRDAIVRMVGEGPAGSFTCASSTFPCGELTLFAPHASLSRRTGVLWSSGNDVEDLTDLNPARTVPLDTVYILTGIPPPASKETIEAAVLDDIATARKTLFDNWTGLLLQPVLRWGEPVIAVLDSDHSCTGEGDLPSVYSQLIDAGVSPDAFGPRRIVAAYVQELAAMTKSGVSKVMGGTYGWACPWHPEYGSIMLVAWFDRAIPVTFTHELLHGIGIVGHPPETPEFYRRSNVMSAGHVSVAARRTYISLGQGFRLSLSDRSIFQRGSTAVGCPNPTADIPCPRLSRDLVKP